LEALGVGVDVQMGDVAVRGNFCTLDAKGILVDRRAGRIATELSRPLSAELAQAIPQIGDVRIELHPGLQHRFALVMRGSELEAEVEDTDPQEAGLAPKLARARRAASGKTAQTANGFVERAREYLRGQDVANGVLLRGFSSRPPLPTLKELAQLSPAAIAAYPAYRGVARMLGMELIAGAEPGCSVADEVTALERAWNDGHDFFFLHVKGTDSAGEDGDEDAKAAVIEAFDAQLPRIRALAPDAIVITGDHSTPGPLAAHSWHPVPTLLYGPWCEPDLETTFDEAACHRGRLGAALPATALIRLAMANAGKLAKFGA
jgi:2,3-bisphosphoglycerate-independent phosphoglycerate mutase